MAISQSTKIILIISIFIVIALGFGFYGLMLYKSKKLKKELDKKELLKAEAKIEEIYGKAIPTFPKDLKKAFDSKISDLDIKQIINTIYLNEAERTLLLGENLEYETVLILLLTKTNLSILPNSIDAKKWNNAVLQFPDSFIKQPNILKNNDKELLPFKLIIAINSNLNNLNLYEKYMPLVENGGLLIIVQNKETKKDLKAFSKFLKLQKIRYEISSIESKFLYIVQEKN